MGYNPKMFDEISKHIIYFLFCSFFCVMLVFFYTWCFDFLSFVLILNSYVVNESCFGLEVMHFLRGLLCYWIHACG
jgi:hypothetical protein